MGSSLQHVGSFVVAYGFLSSCGVRALECAGSVAAACRLSSCGSWALECAGLAALRHVGS